MMNRRTTWIVFPSVALHSIYRNGFIDMQLKYPYLINAYSFFYFEL
jgi:hypothetical protein